MRAVDVILSTREGKPLTDETLRRFVKEYTLGNVADYQMSAWLMAVVLRGLTAAETASLTAALVESGTVLHWPGWLGAVVDKHSTGGVGDKTTLVVAPILAACGCPVAKMSGRGLGHTGGTLDKLESIPGFRVDLSVAQFQRQVAEVGIAIVAQTAELAPADGMLYALRDVTGTVDSLPLIAASIMSKKIAAGAEAIVLDVKVGQAAFMRDLDLARQLARTMTELGRQLERRVAAVISNMDQPLGEYIGNAVEVREAILTLQGQGPADLRQLCDELAVQALLLAGKCERYAEAQSAVANAIASGRALEKLNAMVVAQGGDPTICAAPEKLAVASSERPVVSTRDGYITAIDTRLLGQSVVALGGGRARKGDAIDHAVGLRCRVSLGQSVSRGEELCSVLAHSADAAAEMAKSLGPAFTIEERHQEPPPLIVEVQQPAAHHAHEGEG